MSHHSNRVSSLIFCLSLGLSLGWNLSRCLSLGCRSSMMGDHFIVHSDNAWSHSEQGEVYECAMMGFEHKYTMTLVEFLQNGETRSYGVERVEI